MASQGHLNQRVPPPEPSPGVQPPKINRMRGFGIDQLSRFFFLLFICSIECYILLHV